MKRKDLAVLGHLDGIDLRRLHRRRIQVQQCGVVADGEPAPGLCAENVIERPLRKETGRARIDDLHVGRQDRGISTQRARQRIGIRPPHVVLSWRIELGIVSDLRNMVMESVQGVRRPAFRIPPRRRRVIRAQNTFDRTKKSQTAHRRRLVLPGAVSPGFAQNRRPEVLNVHPSDFVQELALVLGGGDRRLIYRVHHPVLRADGEEHVDVREHHDGNGHQDHHQVKGYLSATHVRYPRHSGRWGKNRG